MRELIEQRIDAARQGRFSFLRRAPNTNVWRTISCYEAQDNNNKSIMRNDFVEIASSAAMALHHRIADIVASTQNGVAPEASRRQFDQVYAKTFFSEFPDRFLRQFAHNQESLAQIVDASRIPSIMQSEMPKVAKAPAIRKALHAGIKERFEADWRNEGGGNWVCRGRVEGQPFLLNVDYGGKGGGFRYSVSFEREESSGEFTPGITLEQSLGISCGAGSWDFTLTDELGDVTETMGDVICNLHAMFQQLRCNQSR